MANASHRYDISDTLRFSKDDRDDHDDDDDNDHDESAIVFESVSQAATEFQPENNMKRQSE